MALHHKSIGKKPMRRQAVQAQTILEFLNGPLWCISSLHVDLAIDMFGSIGQIRDHETSISPALRPDFAFGDHAPRAIPASDLIILQILKPQSGLVIRCTTGLIAVHGQLRVGLQDFVGRVTASND